MRPSINRFNNTSAGYTFIELLTVIVIVAILGAIAVPSWLAYVQNQRIGAVNNDLLQTLKQAQQSAIQRREDVEVAIDTTAPRPTITIADAPVVLAQGSGIRDGLVSLDLQGDSGAATSFIFDYQGMVRNQDIPYVITVDATNGGGREQCVIVATLLGTLKTASEDACTDPAVAP